MMKTCCPRCDAPLTGHDATCAACGHQWHLRCGCCGKLNIPRAVYCGGCGRALNWMDRIRQRWDETFAPITRTRFKSLSTGLAFGGLLTVFAFGSMGMYSPSWQAVTPAWEMNKPGEERLSTETGRQTKADLEAFLESQEDSSRRLTQRDLVRVGNLLLESFGAAIDPDGTRPGLNLNGAVKYLQTLQKSGDSAAEAEVRRGDVAVFFYRLMSDLFEVPTIEAASHQYSDIPRYHFMNLPVETLDALGLHLARGEKVFGGDDAVTLSWLSERSIEVVRSCEARLKQQSFPSLEPRN